MPVVAGDEWYDDSYWSSFTDAEFLEYLAQFPEQSNIPNVDEWEQAKPWPTSVEARRWDYDAPGMREYEAEDDEY